MIEQNTSDLPPGEAFLAGLPRFTDAGALAYRPGLDRIKRLLAEMGNPEERFPCIHIAGTNGKGSTASMLASISTASGLTTGLHTSPHLYHLTERLRIDGIPAPRSWLERAVRRFRPCIEAVGPSFFEATVALSLLYFAEEGVDIAVIEVGMGGRLDATNVVHPSLCVITSIGLDHTAFLGQSIEAISREKAGIIKTGIPVVTSAEQPAALSVLAESAREAGSMLHIVTEETDIDDVDVGIDGTTVTLRTPVRTYPRLKVELRGRHQIPNLRAAVRAAELIIPAATVSEIPVVKGLADVLRLSGLHGRLEVLSLEPLILTDVAHNAEGLAASLAFLGEIGRHRRLFVALGVMKDKDLLAMARLLKDAGARVIPVPIRSHRAWTAEELSERLRGLGVCIAEARDVQSLVREFASSAAPSDTLLLAGSHLVVARLGEPRDL